MKLFLQSLAILISFGLVYLWQSTPLSLYTIQIFGILIVAFLLLSFRQRKIDFDSFLNTDSMWSIIILNTLVFLLIFSTGILHSPLFFLLYFLSFGIAFVFHPATVFVFLAGMVILFFPDMMTGDVTGNLMKTGSLVLVAPLAYFFGREYRQEEKEEQELEMLTERSIDAADTIAADVDVILKDKENLKAEDVEKLNDILEETEVLRSEGKK